MQNSLVVASLISFMHALTSGENLRKLQPVLLITQCFVTAAEKTD